MSVVYGFGSNLHNSFGLGSEMAQLNWPTKLQHSNLVQANWSHAVWRE